jgi:hypothetical protein
MERHARPTGHLNVNNRFSDTQAYAPDLNNVGLYTACFQIFPHSPQRLARPGAKTARAGPDEYHRAVNLVSTQASQLFLSIGLPVGVAFALRAFGQTVYELGTRFVGAVDALFKIDHIAWRFHITVRLSACDRFR